MLINSGLVVMASPSGIRRSFCTTREASKLLGVSLRTAQLWVEQGVLEAWKTTGGHRRIERESVDRLLAPLVHSRSEQPDTGAVLASQEKQPLDVLIVEDEATLRLIYEVTVSRWPMKPNVTTASDGYEALLRIGHHKPDLLITDLHMPGMDGFRMLRTIRGMPELSDMEIVVVSGLEPEVIESGGGVPEGVEIFAKPAPFTKLLDIAKRVVHARGRRQRVVSHE